MMQNKIWVIWAISLIAVLVLAALFLFGLYSGLKIQRYTIPVDKWNHSARIALVSDLHSCWYGKGAQELVEAIEAQKPDLLLLAGDIFDDILDDQNTEAFLQGISGKYPCYYVTGNHEYWSGSSAFADKMEILKQYGVTRLSGKMETVTINGETLNLCGVDDPDADRLAAESNNPRETSFQEQLSLLSAQSQNGNYTVLLSHRPEFFEQYVSLGFNLVLCGHAHGGQWRIPGILNGLYAPNQGLFPKYAGGKYHADKTTMIVSRGLARESTFVPRYYNRPELVIIDLQNTP